MEGKAPPLIKAQAKVPKIAYSRKSQLTIM